MLIKVINIPSFYANVNSFLFGQVYKFTALYLWYSLGQSANMRDENFSQRSFLAVYEVKYVKQNGIWKIKTLDLGIVYWVMDPRLGLAAGPEQLPKLTREQMREERANKQKTMEMGDTTL
jgi:hypothetical protein